MLLTLRYCRIAYCSTPNNRSKYKGRLP